MPPASVARVAPPLEEVLTRHLTEEELLIATSEHPHVRACEDCRQELKNLDTFIETLGAPRVWNEQEPELERPAPRLPGLDVAFRLEEEEEEAGPSVAEILRQPERAAEILARYRLSAGVLHAATTAARQLLDTNPQHGYDLTILAERLAANVNWEGYPVVIAAEHRGRIFKERASALRLMGRHEEALASVDAARAEYGRTVAAAHALAALDYVAAMVLREQGRLAEARELVTRAAMTFTDYGDQTRLLHCRLLEGLIAATGGELRGARELFLELLHSAADDLPVRAQLHNNIGQLSVDLGEYELAATHLLQALGVYRELGMLTEEIRTKWGMARLVVRTGKTPEAIARFHEAESAFLRVGMQVEAALVALDRIETLLATGDRASVTEECRRIYERFQRAGLARNALMALGYLAESLERPAPGIALGRVRTYLERLRSEPALLFLPLP